MSFVTGLAGGGATELIGSALGGASGGGAPSVLDAPAGQTRAPTSTRVALELVPLVRHAASQPANLGAETCVLDLLAAMAGAASFDDVVDELGSRVVARFAVLRLVDAGQVTVSPGYLSSSSIVAATAPAGSN